MRRLELKSKDFYSFISTDSIERIKNSFEIFAAQDYVEEVLYFNTDITTGYRTTFTPVRDLDNNVTRYLVVLADKIYSNQLISELV